MAFPRRARLGGSVLKYVCSSSRRNERENHRMTGEYNQISSKGDHSASHRRYTAPVDQDPALQKTCISLSSIDQSNSSRTIQLCIAPECGSNLYRFLVVEHDLIYTDKLLLMKRITTGTSGRFPTEYAISATPIRGRA